MATSNSSPLRVLLLAIRDGWLIVGITLVLLVLADQGYRVWHRFRHPPPPRMDASPLHPYAQEAWWAQFRGPAGLEGRKNRWDPYRGWRSYPYRAPGITVDSAGVRLTVPAPRDSATALQVVMLGGSAVWGLAARDSFTIPSQVARRLQAGGFDNVQVTNLGLPGYNATQEATTLLVELARGRRPDVVLVMDGYNDMSLAFLYGQPGHAFSEDITQSKLDRGSRGFWDEILGLGRHSPLVRRLAGIKTETFGPESVPVGVGDICPQTSAYYERIVRSMEAMSREYGFDIMFFQQPGDAISRKQRTAWERTFETPPNQLARWRHCSAEIDTAMGPRLGRSYFPLYGIFDRDTGTVFTDRSSHTTERANGAIADHMVEVLMPVLRARAARAAAPVTARP